jgi:type 1 glutamine amidotransferase
MKTWLTKTWLTKIRLIRISFGKILVLGFTLWMIAPRLSPLIAQTSSPKSPEAGKKRLLFIGQSKGWEHDSVSYAAGTLWKLGHDSGLWETYIYTDCRPITKTPLPRNQKNLDYFNAVAFFTTGELDMADSQKADLLAFVKEEGKGFLGIHSATDTFYQWPAYGEMIGGYFDEHPWMTFDAPLMVEDAKFPGMQYLSPAFTMRDEIYQIKDFSRERVRVLLRLDENKLDLANPRVHRTDKDFPVIWARDYGKGRVLYNGLGHVEAVWDRPEIQKMLIEQVRWVLGTVPGDATPRPRPAK